jgi:hypothetical protein
MPELQDSPLPDAPRREGPLPMVDERESLAPALSARIDSGVRMAPRASDATPASSSDQAATGPATPQRRPFWTRAWVILGAVGAAGGAVVLGVVAHRVAHPPSTVALIAALGGGAGGAMGAALPALVRAIKWSAIAAATLAVAAAALWAIHQVDPFLIRQFVPRW